MKLLYLISLCVLGFFVPTTLATENYTKDYSTFEVVNLSKGKLIRNWTSKEIEKYQENVSKRKFSGWRVTMINQEVEATFESDVLFSFSNTGTSEIEYSKTITYEKNAKTSISCSGGITYKTSGTVKKFKHNLDASVNFSYSNTSTVEQKQTDTVKMKIDPGYKAIVYMTGTARVTNGYAQRYLFWCRQGGGAFEYFTITSQYPRIKKVKI